MVSLFRFHNTDISTQTFFLDRLMTHFKLSIKVDIFQYNGKWHIYNTGFPLVIEFLKDHGISIKPIQTSQGIFYFLGTKPAKLSWKHSFNQKTIISWSGSFFWRDVITSYIILPRDNIWKCLHLLKFTQFIFQIFLKSRKLLHIRPLQFVSSQVQLSQTGGVWNESWS